MGKSVLYCDALLGQELLDGQGAESRCVFVVEKPRSGLPQFSHLPAHLAQQTPQDPFVVLSYHQACGRCLSHRGM